MWTFVKLILRRDRVKLPIWVGAISLSLVMMVPVLQQTFGDDASIETLFGSFGVNPAGLFLTGPMDAANFGSLMTIETLLWWGLAIAFMNTLFIVRHTRQNEEMGAQELLLSGRVRRSASLMSALMVAVMVNAVTGLIIGGGLFLVAGDLWSVESSWLFGIGFMVFGIVWAAISSVVVQLFESTRSANGVLAALIGAAFVLRGIGDFMGKAGNNGLIQPTWVSQLSPFGWMQATRGLTFPDWSPLLIPLVVAIGGVVVAFLLLARRDVGAGLLPSKRGRVRAGAFRRTSFGLTWHLQRNICTGWLLGVLAMVGVIGMLAPEMTHVYESSDSMKMLIASLGGEGAIMPTFLSAMLAIIILMVGAYTIQGVAKLRDEEAAGHLENLLATRLSRLGWMWRHVSVVLVMSALMLAATGFMLAICVNTMSDSSVDIGEYTLAGISYMPVILLFIGIYMLLFGVMPRIASLVSWSYFGFTVFMSWLAPLLDLDKWVMNLSLLEHISSVPAQDFKLMPLVWISVIAVVMIALGCWAWSRRNLIER